MGDVTLVGSTPSGHQGILMPSRIFFVAESHAALDGVDLGEPIRMRENPRIGEVGLPARPTFAIGQGYFKIGDEEEYRRTVEELRQSAGERPRASTPVSAA
jgi:hypothetical protein